MQEDIFILSGDSEREIGIEDCTYIEYVLNCKFNPFVDSVFDKTKTIKFISVLWQLNPAQAKLP